MTYATILAPTDGGDGARVALNAALHLAKRFNAKIDILALAAPATPLFAADAYAAGVYASALDVAREAAETALKDAVEIVEAADVPYDTAMLASPLASIQEAVATRALFADLIVASRNGQSSEVTSRVIDGALFNAPAPLLIWPPDVDPVEAASLGKRPSIAWDARPQASLAARFALPLIAEAESVAVATVSHDFGDEPYEDEPGERFVEWLQRQGVVAELRQLEGDVVAEVLLNDAAARQTDLIVMGGYGHTQLREAIFGGVTETLLRTSPLPLFMAH